MLVVDTLLEPPVAGVPHRLTIKFGAMHRTAVTGGGSLAQGIPAFSPRSGEQGPDRPPIHPQIRCGADVNDDPRPCGGHGARTARRARNATPDPLEGLERGRRRTPFPS